MLTKDKVSLRYRGLRVFLESETLRFKIHVVVLLASTTFYNKYLSLLTTMATELHSRTRLPSQYQFKAS